jgi:hypothetical protein
MAADLVKRVLGVFLATTTAVFVLMLLAFTPGRVRNTLPGLIGGAVVAIV